MGEIRMKNRTTIKVPKKYQHMLEEVFQTPDGYWGHSKDGYFFQATEGHIAKGNTQAELLQDIRTLMECDCEDCKGKK